MNRCTYLIFAGFLSLPGCDGSTVAVPIDRSQITGQVTGFTALFGDRYLIGTGREILTYDAAVGWESAPFAMDRRTERGGVSRRWRLHDIEIGLRDGVLVVSRQGESGWTVLPGQAAASSLVDAAFGVSWPPFGEQGAVTAADGPWIGYALDADGTAWKARLNQSADAVVLERVARLEDGWSPIAIAMSPNGPVSVLAGNRDDLRIFRWRN